MRTTHVDQETVRGDRGGPVTGDGGNAPPPLEEMFRLDEGPMRRDLMRQIAALSAALSAFIVEHAPFERVPPKPVRGPAILSTSELEEVRDELLAALADLRSRAADRFTERLTESLEEAVAPARRRGPLARRRSRRDA